MRIRISILAVLFSVSLLELYHHTDALGIDSASHGLLYGGRVVRRYGSFGRDSMLNKRYLRGLQERADPQDNKDSPKGKEPKEPKGEGGAKEKEPKEKEEPKGKQAPKAKEKEKDEKDDKNPPAKAKDDDKPKEPKEKEPNVPATPEISAKEPEPKEPVNKEEKNPANDPSDTDTTSANQDQAPAPAVEGTPTVPTGDMSSSAVIGLVSIGGVFALVAGLFAFSKRRKNKEITRNIMTTSAKAWEHQNSTYEKMDEETNPIGSYTVIATYTPTLSDELDIQPGDRVTILVEFDDGWVQGINETRGGTKGVFPRHCVDMDHFAPNINKRSSSIGVYAEKYTEVDLN